MLAPTLPNNSDLVWELAGRQYPENTFGFLKRFETALCLFSGTVSQLYSNYEIMHFGVDQKKLVALPNAFAAHDTFDNVPADAVEPTGLYIIPSELTKQQNKQELLLLYFSKKKNGLKTKPLLEGLEMIKNTFLPNEPFLPVMINHDLKSLNGKAPAMHLHRIRLNLMPNVSGLVRTDISKAVIDKMRDFYKEDGFKL